MVLEIDCYRLSGFGTDLVRLSENPNLEACLSVNRFGNFYTSIPLTISLGKNP
jgi:hypothetical protein